MKIALVLFDWFAYGGLQRDCRRIGESLLAADCAVDVLCMSWEGPVPEGFNRVMPEIRTRNKVAARNRFAAFLADHLASHSYAAVIGFNRLPGLDFYFAADTCFAWKATRERNLFYRWAPRSRQYLAFERAVFGPSARTQLLMLSPLQKQEYLACYPQSEARMTDIPPGIARDRMAPDDASEVRREFRREFSLAADDLVLLQVGSSHPIKGVDRSLAAIAALPEALRQRVHYFLLGPDRHQRHANEARQLGIESGVTILDQRNDLPRFYQGADLLLQPSRKESAGMVLLEAIVAGLPVLATATCGYAFHVEKAGAGVVVPAPFSQQTMNERLVYMLNADRTPWRNNGIAYGRQGDFYDMPDRVAQRVLDAAGKSDHGH